MFPDTWATTAEPAATTAPVSVAHTHRFLNHRDMADLRARWLPPPYATAGLPSLPGLSARWVVRVEREFRHSRQTTGNRDPTPGQGLGAGGNVGASSGRMPAKLAFTGAPPAVTSWNRSVTIAPTGGG